MTLLSRIANNLYGLSRYPEPADFMARMLGKVASSGRDPQSLVRKVRAGVPLGCNAESGKVAAEPRVTFRLVLRCFPQARQVRGFCVRAVRIGLALIFQRVSADGLADGIMTDTSPTVRTMCQPSACL